MKKLPLFLMFLACFGAGCSQNNSPTPPPSNTYGMVEYTDEAYGFSFWYPSTIQIESTSTQDTTNFPGGTAVKTLSIGPSGGSLVYVVEAAGSSITDEPNGHASPIAQTKYFYDSTSAQWMVTFPEGRDDNGSAASTTADVSKKTMGGLPMLHSGRRFATTIIPLSTTRFVVVTDGGGSAFTNELAQTVSQNDATIHAQSKETALKAEADAFTRE
jgi:hypothetical protein